MLSRRIFLYALSAAFITGLSRRGKAAGKGNGKGNGGDNGNSGGSGNGVAARGMAGITETATAKVEATATVKGVAKGAARTKRMPTGKLPHET